jgi:DNA-binding phage protein
MPRTEALKTLARHNGVSRREIYKALFVEEEETR